VYVVEEKLKMKPFHGFFALVLAVPAFAQYSTPSILSRGEAPSGMTEETENGMHFSVTLTANHTNGALGSLTSNQSSSAADQGTTGAGAAVTVREGLNWEHTQFTANYSGSFQDYSQTTTYSGLNQGLSFQVVHQFAPHIALSIKEKAGMSSHLLPSVSEDSSSAADSPQISVPATDFFGNLSILSNTQANVTIQQTARLSFDVGGTYFLNELHQAGGIQPFFGAQGEVAMGDVQYRLSPHVLIGANYNFAHYAYTQGIGGAYIHSAAFTGSYRMSPSTEISGFVGPARMETSFEQAVPIDPGFLAVLCPPGDRVACPVREGVVIAHGVSWIPSFRVRLARTIGRGTAFLMAGETTAPGNGLFLTSRITTAAFGYSYSFLKDWNLSLGSTYMDGSSLGNAVGHYSDLGATYRLTRRIAGPLSFISSFTATRYSSAAASAYNRLIYIASVGIRYSTADRAAGLF
jgi:hypothetical protein